MAVAFDAAVGTTGTGTSSSASLNHAANVEVLIAVSYIGTTSPSSVTVGGVGATSRSKVSQSTNMTLEVYSLTDAAAGNDSIVVTFASSTRHAWNAVSYTGAGPAPYENLTTGNNTGASPQTATATCAAGTTGRVVFSAAGGVASANATGSITIAPANGETQRGTTSALAGSGSTRSVSSEVQDFSGSASHASNATITKSSTTLQWATVTFALLPSTPVTITTGVGAAQARGASAPLTTSATAVTAGAGRAQFTDASAKVAVGPLPTDFSGLVAWHQADQLGLADNATVSSWTDSGSNGYNLPQWSTNNLPVYKQNIKNGLGVVRFTAASTQALGFNTGGMLGAWQVAGYGAIFVVYKPTSATAKGDVVFIEDGTNGVGRFGHSVSETGQVGKFTLFGRRLDSDPAQFVSGGSITANNWYIASCLVEWSNANARIRINGVEVANALGTFQTAGLTSNTSSWEVGVGCSGGASYFDGDIAEVIWYNAQITPTDAAQIETYLNNKWNVFSSGTNASVTAGAGTAQATDASATTAATALQTPGPGTALSGGVAAQTGISYTVQASAATAGVAGTSPATSSAVVVTSAAGTAEGGGASVSTSANVSVSEGTGTTAGVGGASTNVGVVVNASVTAGVGTAAGNDASALVQTTVVVTQGAGVAIGNDASAQFSTSMVVNPGAGTAEAGGASAAAAITTGISITAGTGTATANDASATTASTVLVTTGAGEAAAGGASAQTAITSGIFVTVGAGAAGIGAPSTQATANVSITAGAGTAIGNDASAQVTFGLVVQTGAGEASAVGPSAKSTVTVSIAQGAGVAALDGASAVTAASALVQTTAGEAQGAGVGATTSASVLVQTTAGEAYGDAPTVTVLVQNPLGTAIRVMTMVLSERTVGFTLAERTVDLTMAARTEDISMATRSVDFALAARTVGFELA